MNFEQARFNMVEQQIRTWNVLDTSMLQALSHLPREQFVPAAYQSLAYTDTEIPLGHGQQMLAPKVAARLAHDLHLQGTESVLQIGAGSGYLTALLAQRSQQVLALEVVPELAQMAQSNLARAGVHNAQVRQADGASANPSEGPFDAIVLSGSVAEVPSQLLNQLKVGGQLIAVVGQEPVMQTTLTKRVSPTHFSSQVLWDTCVPALTGFAQPSRFKF